MFDKSGAFYGSHLFENKYTDKMKKRDKVEKIRQMQNIENSAEQ
jgi:hypothetical protein